MAKRTSVASPKETVATLRSEIDRLLALVAAQQERLEESEALREAIHRGAVDAFVLAPDGEPQVSTLETVGQPYWILVERMQQGAVTLSKDGTMTYCNERFAGLVGAELEALLGQDFTSWVQSRHGERWKSLFSAGKAIGSQGELELIGVDGMTVPAHVAVNPMGASDGACLIVTDLRQQEWQQILQGILENVPEGIAVADAPDVRIRFESRYGREMTARSTEQLAQIPLEEHAKHWPIRHSDGRLASFEELPLSRATINGETIIGEEWVLERGDGQLVSILCNAGPIRNGESEITGGIITWRDISDRKAAEAALRDADRRKDEFIALLAHELRNPLGPIGHAVQLMDLLSPADSEHVELRAIIQRQVTHMVRLIDDLLDVARITQGKIELKLEPVDLVALGNSLVTDHANAFVTHQLKLRTSFPDGPLIVHGDRVRLYQVFGNLLTNAIKFTDHGGSIDFAIRSDNEQASISIRDDGIGMNADTLQQVFEPFVQAASSLGRSEGGLGLGLAVVKGLVTLHGGIIRASSDGVGHGSTFTVTLPLCAYVEPLVTRRSPSEAGRPRRVVVIEDQPDAARTVALLLTHRGHEVILAKSGEEGVSRAQEIGPDIVLCDIRLPGEMDGYAVARCLRQRLPEAILIATTGYGQEADRQRAEEAGFHHHMTKPISVDDLLLLLTK